MTLSLLYAWQALSDLPDLRGRTTLFFTQIKN